jgi:hypothetical protein
MLYHLDSLYSTPKQNPPQVFCLRRVKSFEASDTANHWLRAFTTIASSLATFTNPIGATSLPFTFTLAFYATDPADTLTGILGATTIRRQNQSFRPLRKKCHNNQYQNSCPHRNLPY